MLRFQRPNIAAGSSDPDRALSSALDSSSMMPPSDSRTINPNKVFRLPARLVDRRLNEQCYVLAGMSPADTPNIWVGSRVRTSTLAPIKRHGGLLDRFVLCDAMHSKPEKAK